MESFKFVIFSSEKFLLLTEGFVFKTEFFNQDEIVLIEMHNSLELIILAQYSKL